MMSKTCIDCMSTLGTEVYLDELWNNVGRVAMYNYESGAPCSKTGVKVMQAVQQEAKSVCANPAMVQGSVLTQCRVAVRCRVLTMCIFLLAVACKPGIKHKHGVQMLAVLQCFQQRRVIMYAKSLQRVIGSVARLYSSVIQQVKQQSESCSANLLDLPSGTEGGRSF